MLMSDKDRKLMKSEAIKRLDFLVSRGLNTDIAKKFKGVGRVYVNEMITSDWADRNGKTNCSFPRTYVLVDTVPEVTEEMLNTRLKLENDGYLVYLITREKRNSPRKENCTDRIEYFIIDKPTETYLYPMQESSFREGKAKVFVQDVTKGTEEFDYVNYKVRLEQVIITKEEN